MTAEKMTPSSVVLIGLHYTSACRGCANAAPVCETASFMHRRATPNLISQSQGKSDLRHDQAHLYYPLTWLHTLKLFLHNTSDTESHGYIFQKTRPFPFLN